VPSAADAIEIVKGRVVLVDGTLTLLVLRGAPGTVEQEAQDHGLQHAVDIPSRRVRRLDIRPAARQDSRREGIQGDRSRLYREGIRRRIRRQRLPGQYQGSGLVTPKKKPQDGELTMSDKEYNSQIASFRAPVERLVAHFKNWKIFHSDYRRPYSTYDDAFNAARGLFFFSITWGFE